VQLVQQQKKIVFDNSKLNAIVVQQAFDGSWSLTQQFAIILGLTLQQLEQEMAKVSSLSGADKEKLWASAIALTVLTLKFKHLKEDWEMMGDKTKLFLNTILGSETKTKALLDSAKAALVLLNV